MMEGIKLLPTLMLAALKDPKEVKSKLIRGIVNDIIDGRLRTTLLVMAIHVTTTYIGLWLCSESHLVKDWVEFAYYYVTTGSTVGYGDLSPTTRAGKIFVITYVMFGSISLFAYLLTKILASIGLFVRKYMSGFGSFNDTKNHLVIVGYVSGQTESLLSETKFAQKGCETVILTVKDNLPLNDKIRRVRTTSLASEDDLLRAGIEGAKSIVVMAETDDETVSACLAISAIRAESNFPGHVVAYLRNEEKARLIRPHCPSFEFVVSTSVQQVSRAIVDPGASQVFSQLASTAVGATLNSIDYAGPDTSIGELSIKFMSLGATLIGYRRDDAHVPCMELRPETKIGEEHTLFYISSRRLPCDALSA